MKTILLAFVLLISYVGYGQDACSKAFTLKGLNKFSGKIFKPVAKETELPCTGNCVCRTYYITAEGSAGLRISTDAGRKEYRSLLGMATNSKAVAAADWLYAFTTINNSNPALPQMSLILHAAGKTYFAYVSMYKSEEETKAFLIELLLRATSFK